MIPTNFPEANTIFSPTNNTADVILPVTGFRGLNEAGSTVCIIAWTPSYEDLQNINAGKPIFVQVIGESLPPHTLFTLDEGESLFAD